MKTTSTIKSEAKSLMRGRFVDILKIYWPLLVMTLITAMISGGTSTPNYVTPVDYSEMSPDQMAAMSTLATYSMGSAVASILAAVATLFIDYGSIFATHKLVTTGDYNQSILKELKGERPAYALISAVGVTIANSLIGFAVGAGFVFVALMTLAAMFGGLGEGGVFLIVLLAVAFMFVILYFTLPLSYVNYFLADWDQGIGNVPSEYGQSKFSDVFDAIKASYKAAKGRRWDMIAFDLSFFFWYIGIAFSLGLLAIYFVPYYTIAQYGFYRDRLSGIA